MFVLLAMSWRFLRPYFLIAMIILTFWWSKKETKRLIFSKYSSGAIWLKYGPKKTWGQSELFKVLREAEVSRFARVLSSHFAVDTAGWPPFSEEIIGSLGRSTLTLKTPKDPIAARFRALAERVETFV